MKKISRWLAFVLLAVVCWALRRQLQLDAVPPVVWSGIAGSVLTILGGAVTNREHARRHREQLESDAQEHKKAREHEQAESAVARTMLLKREVYLPAIAGAVTASQSIGKLINVNTPRAEIDKAYFDGVAALTKSGAVAHIDAVAAVSRLVTGMTVVYASLAIRRDTLESLHAKYVANSNTVTKVVGDQTKWTEVQTQLVYEGPPPMERWNFVANQLAFIQGQIVYWMKARDEALRALQIAQVEFFDELQTHGDDLHARVVDANIALRRELGLPSEDESALRLLLAENHADAMRRLVEVHKRLRVNIAAPDFSPDQTLS
jgi:hypothetical protein